MARKPEIPTAAALIESTTRLGRPAAFQAMWGGDTQGWMVRLEAVFPSNTTYRAANLALFRLGGDIRVFQGAVPPWPEARVATELGEALASHFGVPFWFPSPDEPESDCPAWWERDQAHPCEDCGKPILSHNSAHMPDEVCYHCLLAREQRERIRSDKPASGGVTVLYGPPGQEHRAGYATVPASMRIARVALELTAAATAPGDLVVEGDLLRRAEEQMYLEANALLAQLDARAPRKSRMPPQFERRRKVTFEGRELELELQFDDLAQNLDEVISDVEMARRAIRDGLRYWLVFSRDITERGDHVLRLLRQADGTSTIAALSERCRDVLDADEVRAALVRLADLGHVVIEVDSAQLTPTGWHVGG